VKRHQLKIRKLEVNLKVAPRLRCGRPFFPLLCNSTLANEQDNLPTVIKDMKQTNKSMDSTSYYDVNVNATVIELISILGDPADDSNTGEDKVNYEWSMETEDGDVFTVYDWKQYRMIDADEKIEWHIGGHTASSTQQAATEILDALANAKSISRKAKKKSKKGASLV
jgi:hypothetical protein